MDKQLKLVVNNIKEEEEGILVENSRLKLSMGDPPDGNWLSLLEDGTIFLVQDKLSALEFALGLFRLIGKEARAVHLAISANGTLIDTYVDPLRFCRKYKLYEILGIIKEPGSESDPEGDLTEDQSHTTPTDKV